MNPFRYFVFLFLILFFASSVSGNSNCGGYNPQLLPYGTPCGGSTASVVVTDADSASIAALYDAITFAPGAFQTSYGSDSIVISSANGIPAGTYMAIVQYGNCDDTIGPITLYTTVNDTITVTGTQNAYCNGGHNITLTATAPANTQPVYQWVVNGAYVGAHSHTYTGNFNNGDLVWCINEAGNVCAVPAVLMSNQIRLTISGEEPVTVSPAHLCMGDVIMLNNATGADSITWYSSNNAVLQTSGASGLTNIRAGNSSGTDSLNSINPGDMVVDSAGNIYVTDITHNRVLFFPAGSTASTYGTVIAGNNGTGSAANQLNSPQSICFDSQHNLYVLDNDATGKPRVLKFAAGSNQNTNAVTVTNFTGITPTPAPSVLRADAAGDLYVSDVTNDRVLRIPSGSVNYQTPVAVQVFTNLTNVMAVDAVGGIYLYEPDNATVTKFEFNPNTHNTLEINIAGGNGTGSAANQFDDVTGMLFDETGNLYILDKLNSRIQKFAPGSTTASNGITYVHSDLIYESSAGNMGFDGQGNVYLSNYQNVTSNVTELLMGQTLNTDTQYTPNAPAVYKEVINPPGGCPAITIYDTVNALGYGVTYGRFCYGQTYTYNGVQYDTTGSYIFTYSGAAADGCDSVFTLSLNADLLTIQSPGVYMVGGDTIGTDANGTGYTYQWLLNGQVLTSDTTDEIIATTSGNYEVIVTDNLGCTSKPGYLDGNVGIAPVTGIAQPVLYPDPNTGAFILQFTDATEKQIEITDVTGRLIQSTTIAKKQTPFNLGTIAPGVYFIRINQNGLMQSMKFVVER